MHILISGASGLIGQALTRYLRQQGHKVEQLIRDNHHQAFHWQPHKALIHLPASIHLDAVINLNGVNIADRLWSKKRKQAIIDSRVESTQLLAKTLAQHPHPPKILINASAIGYYGDTGSNEVDETSPAGNNFLTKIVTQWESSAQAAMDAGIRTVFIRSGIVLSASGGALAKMLLPFKLGLGGKIGSGLQYMSWITLEDELRAIEFILNHDEINGAVNLTSPLATCNDYFSKTLAKVLARPALLPMPAFIVRLLFGEMGDLLLLGSARVKPEILIQQGFQFNHKNINSALEAIIKSNK
ncbi:MAG: TIGR01777 family protein [Oleispira sp.]|nr:TIGR01777 family protein [Oleispira sp.]